MVATRQPLVTPILTTKIQCPKPQMSEAARASPRRDNSTQRAQRATTAQCAKDKNGRYFLAIAGLTIHRLLLPREVNAAI
jgi:hypothetical protein